MSFSTTEIACLHASLPSLLEGLALGALFVMVRFGPHLAELLHDDLERFPVRLGWLFQIVGWSAALFAGTILSVMGLSAAYTFFFLGLGFAFYYCLGAAWLLGAIVAGPGIVFWQRHGSRIQVFSIEPERS